MIITYKWSITSLDCIVSIDGLSNVVENIHWRYIGTSNLGNMFEMYGVQKLELPNQLTFTEYENLTLEIITSWLSKKININELEREIESNIYKIENPIKISIPPPF